MDRRSSASVRPDRRPSQNSIPNVFDDGYALQPVRSAASDRPISMISNNSIDESFNSSTGAELLQRSSGSRHSTRRPMGSILRNSIAKPRRREPSTHSLSRTSSVTSVSDVHSGSTLQRSITQSSISTPRAQSPYRGATGPSQPYAMYSQVAGISRTPSVATMSTVRGSEAAYSGPNRPSQPYGRHGQNTVTEDEDETSLTESSRPTVVVYPPGVRAAPLPSQRRLGPDGEDMDGLIGPDGYTEQLPPYTRYANNIPPKRDPDDSSLRETPTTTHAPTIPLAEPPSQTLPQTSPPINTPTDLEHSLAHHPNQDPFSDTSTAVSSTSLVQIISKDESGSFSQRAQSRIRRRVCWDTMPCWLFSVIIVIICLAVALGAVIGGVLAHYHGRLAPPPSAPSPQAVNHPTSPATTATVTATLAAQTPDDGLAASVPSVFPAIPTGSFSVSLTNPSLTTNSCLTDPGQANSWDCSTGAHLDIVVNMPVGAVSQPPVIAVLYPPPPSPVIRLGAQPPRLGGYTSMILMKDRSAPNRGAAYAFQQQFDKVVIVAEHDFPGSVMTRKRGLEISFVESEKLYRRQQSDWAEASFAKPGDRPWYCFWNQTTLEGFVYVTRNLDSSSTAAQALPSSTAPASARYAKRQVNSASPEYPKLIKMEERRKAETAKPPYCQQFSINDDFSIQALLKMDGTANIVNVTEQTPTHLIPPQDDQQTASLAVKNAAVVSQNACMCVWLNS